MRRTQLTYHSHDGLLLVAEVGRSASHQLEGLVPNIMTNNFIPIGLLQVFMPSFVKYPGFAEESDTRPFQFDHFFDQENKHKVGPVIPESLVYTKEPCFQIGGESNALGLVRA